MGDWFKGLLAAILAGATAAVGVSEGSDVIGLTESLTRVGVAVATGALSAGIGHALGKRSAVKVLAKALKVPVKLPGIRLRDSIGRFK